MYEYKIYKSVYDEIINGTKTIEIRLLNDKSDKIKSGDTLESIADKFKTNPSVFINSSIVSVNESVNLVTNSISSCLVAFFISSIPSNFSKKYKSARTAETVPPGQ